ncbi:ATP-binding cassette domain-containing protein [Pedobacter planticolens]|nr:ABC transporter ATP-binding protein [Pedobacter planticolens]
MIKLIVFDLMIGILDIAFLGLMLLVIDFYTKSNTEKNIFHNTYFGTSNSLVLIVIFFLLFSIKNWFGYYVSSLQRHFFFNVASRLSKRNIKHYINENYSQFVNIGSAAQIRKISQQPVEFSNYILVNLQQVISQGILIFFTIVAILTYHPSLFLLLFLLLLPPVVGLGYFIRLRLKNIRGEIKVTSEKALQHLQESLAGYVENNIYNSADFFIDRYYTHQKKLNTNIATQQALQSLPARMIEVFAILGFLILLAVNKFASPSLNINLLEIGIFMAAAYKIIPGIVKILSSVGQIKAYDFTLTDLLPGSTPKQKSSAKHTSIEMIRFEEVKFQYGNQQPIKKMSFEINAGDFVGVTGKSGAGKTTIIHLLVGFLAPNAGSISFNYATADEATRQSFWNRISYVKQQQFIFNDTIANNICLSNTVNEIKLAEVVEFCGLANLLNQYPKGIHQIVTENGKNISGGQRQRIILARALYHDFDLLILDEPFNEMDEVSEKRILNKLVALAKTGKIIMLITHDELGLTFCNKIIPIGDE